MDTKLFIFKQSIYKEFGKRVQKITLLIKSFEEDLINYSKLWRLNEIKRKKRKNKESTASPPQSLYTFNKLINSFVSLD